MSYAFIHQRFTMSLLMSHTLLYFEPDSRLQLFLFCNNSQGKCENDERLITAIINIFVSFSLLRLRFIPWILWFFHIGFRFAQKKLHLLTYIPKPDMFFTPLYHNYGGNFKVSENNLSSARRALCAVSLLSQQGSRSRGLSEHRGVFPHWRASVMWMTAYRGFKKLFFSSWHIVGRYLYMPPKRKVPLTPPVCLWCADKTQTSLEKTPKSETCVWSFWLSYSVSMIIFSINVVDFMLLVFSPSLNILNMHMRLWKNSYD